ncbi:MAG: ABC transporter permease subunit [Candidatus Bathyarchaeia archaeon]
MKALTLAFKDAKRLVKSPRFIFALLLSSFAVIGLRILLSTFLLQLFSIYVARFIFTFTLPFLLLAILVLNSDIMSYERSEGTILTLFSQPISNASIVLGKFLAMLSTSVAFTSFNALMIVMLHPYIWETTGFISQYQFLSSFFFAAMLFQLPVIGLTLLFSSLFKRSAVVTILVILACEIPAIIYASQLMWQVQNGAYTLLPLHSVRQILTMLIGSILGYDLILTARVFRITFKEPEILKFIPVNVNAQRVYYFLSTTNPDLQVIDITFSIISLIALTLATVTISILIVRRWRAEYLE